METQAFINEIVKDFNIPRETLLNNSIVTIGIGQIFKDMYEGLREFLYFVRDKLKS